MDTFRKAADSSLQDFSKYLNNFRSDVTGARSNVATATNPAGTEADLTGALSRYQQGLAGANTTYQGALAGQASNERGVVSQANADLPLYDKALTNIEANNLAQAQRDTNKFRLGTGVPSGMGSDAAALLARESTQAALPIELAKVNKRYDILQNLALPVEQQIAGANINYAGSFLPSIAGAGFGAATTTANTIQNLRERVAGMSIADATAFMQMAGIPAQIQQQILSGQIGQLGQLGALEDQSRYRGLQDVLGVNPSQPEFYSPGIPDIPNYSARYPRSANPLGPNSGNAPINVGPTGNPLAPGAIDPTTGGYAYRPLPGAPGGPPVSVPGAGGIPNYPPSDFHALDLLNQTGTQGLGDFNIPNYGAASYA